MFICELNDMEPWVTNIGNAYLGALKSEKFVSELAQSLDLTSKDTCLSSTKHCMDYDLAEKYLVRCYKNVSWNSDLCRLLQKDPSI